MPKELTKDEISEFKKLKEWVSRCPVEATMRIQELEETNKKNYRIAADFKFENLKLEQQNNRYREAIEFGIEYLKNSDIRQVQLVVTALKSALEESK